MKKYNLNDTISFGKYSGKTVSWLLNNKGDYIDWCYKNIEDFIITNNDDLVKDDRYEIENFENELVAYKKYTNYLKESYFTLEERLNHYKKKEAVIYDKNKKLYYNIFLDIVDNNQKINDNWFQFGKLSYQSKSYDLHNDKIIDNLKIKYKDNFLEINLNNLYISKDFIQNVTYPQKESGPDDFQTSSAVLYTPEKNMYVITYGLLNLEEVGEVLYSGYKRVGGSREDGDFEYQNSPFSYIKDENGFKDFKENECKKDNFDDIPF